MLMQNMIKHHYIIELKTQERVKYIVNTYSHCILRYDMWFSRVVFIFVCTTILHCQITSSSWTILVFKDSEAIDWSVVQGLNYLLYPFCGLVVESYLKKFNFIKWACLLVIISSTAQLIIGILEFKDVYNNIFTNALGTFGIFTGTFGLSMFEANAIRFGMNQMLDASSEQLSSFIHCYFWCSNAGILIIFYVPLVVLISTNKCHDLFRNWKFCLGSTLLSSSCIQIIGSFFGLVWGTKCNFSERQNSENPIKLVYKVLAYSYQHKYPERRSAFTYWENDIPSRIDLGKDKYGGPFTYEQVEDVKTFFRLLLLMISLFGFHLLGDGYSLVRYIIKTTGCPIVPLMTIYINPQHIPTVVVLVTIPLYQVAKKRFFRFYPNMLSQIWIGLYIALIAESLQAIVGMFVSEKESVIITHYNHSIVLTCIFKTNMVQVSNGSCVSACVEPSSHNYVAWIAAAIVLILYGLSYVLVFMTTVEFISAQSPNSTKGLLIGIWYSMLSIKYIFVNTLDIIYLETVSWSVYNGCKGVGLFVSIGLFSFIAKNYRYREKNEVVNSQAMIEEQYERELLLNESSASCEVDSD